VRIRQPRVQRPHRDLDGKRDPERQEQPAPGRCAERQLAAVDLLDDLRHGERPGLVAEPQDRQQHQQAARHRVQEELDRRVDPFLCAPDPDQEVHRHQGEFPKNVEEDHIQREEHTHHAHFKQQEEAHKTVDAFLHRLPGGEDGDGCQESGQQHHQYTDAIHAQMKTDRVTAQGKPRKVNFHLNPAFSAVKLRQHPKG